MGWIKDYVLEIAAFIILISVVNMIMPKGGAARMARLVLAAALLCVMITPLSRVFSLFNGDAPVISSLESAAFAYDNAALLGAANGYEEEQRAAVLQTYRNSLEEKLSAIVEADAAAKQAGYSVKDVYFGIDETDESFGRVTFINLTLSQREKEKPKQPLIRVEKPQIKVNIYGDKTVEQVEADEFLSLKSQLSNFYGVDNRNIFIEVIVL